MRPSTWKHLSKKGDLTSRTPEEQSYRKEEKTPGVVMQKTSKPGLLRTRGSVLDMRPSTWEHLSKKGDLTSRTPEEQPYRTEEKTPGVVMQKTSKPGLLRTRGSVWERLSKRGVVMEKTSKPGLLRTRGSVWQRLSKKRDLTSRTPEEQRCRKNHAGVVMQKKSKPGLLRTRGSVWERLSKRGVVMEKTSKPGWSRLTGEVRRFRSLLHQIVKTGLKKFNVSSPIELQDYLTYVADRMDSAGLLRTRGSVLDEPPSTWEPLSKNGDLTSRTPEEHPYRKEEKTPVQESPAVKHLRETMDDKQLREFVTVHVHEGAWQVVVLFWDKLLHRDSKDNDEDAVSGDLKSRKLTWWPTDEEHGLGILIRVLTQRDHKLTDEGAKHIAEALTICQRYLYCLVLSGTHVTDEGVKHIAEALCSGQVSLNSLYLRSNDVTDEGVKHIAEVLSRRQCHLNSLHLGWNKVTDEGVKHIAEALSSSHCCLESLDLMKNKVTDEGVKHISEALSSRHCCLKSLYLGGNKVTDEGVKHIAEALSSRQGSLNSLDLRWNNVTDEGVKHIAEALSRSQCHLNSLHLGGNKVTDEGVKHIAEALSSSHCRLGSLYLIENKVTDEGVKHIAEALSSSHCRLETLYLCGNKVTNEGVKHIAEALSNTYCRLNFLNLSCNDNITGKGLTLLAEELVHSNYVLKAKGSSIFVTAKVKSRMSEEGSS